MLDLRSLRYFVAAVEEGSISGASLRCHVAQPSITLAISKLEDEFSCQLLHRHRKGVDTTDKGQELYHMALELLQHAGSIENRLNASQAPRKLRLSIDKSIQVSYLETLVSASKEIGIPVAFELCDLTEDVDLCITTKKSEKANELFYPIANERYGILIPNSNELAHRRELSLADLDGQAIIERRYCENRPLFEKILEHFDLNLPIVAQVDNEEWAMALVAAGIGISISPLPLDYSDPRFKIRRIEELLDMETPERQVGLRFSRNVNPETQKILDAIGEHLTQYRTTQIRKT